jgi:hypothetical protein
MGEEETKSLLHAHLGWPSRAVGVGEGEARRGDARQEASEQMGEAWPGFATNSP